MTTFISLYVSAIIILLIIIFINKSKANNQLTKIFSLTLFCTEIWVIALLCQFTLAEKYGIPPIYFDYVASFVVYRHGTDVLMSARSLGEINVQVVLEALGGGGNSTTAGGRVENGDIDDVETRLKETIDAYFEK